MFVINKRFTVRLEISNFPFTQRKSCPSDSEQQIYNRSALLDIKLVADTLEVFTAAT